MKYKIFLIIILFLCFPTLIFSGELHGDFKIGKSLEFDIAFAAINISYEIEFSIMKLMIYGGWLTWFELTDSFLSNKPFRDIYSVGSRLYIYNLFIDINHFCNHPVFSGFGTTWNKNIWGENLSTVSIGIEW